MGLPAVPNTPEWMCPLCEVDQLSAEEDLYPESDLEELQEILIDMEENAADEVNSFFKFYVEFRLFCFI